MAKEIIYEKIYNDIARKIKSGELLPGMRIPSEMELAKEYGVSRITSKKAMELLAANNLADRSRGRGSFVSKYAKDILDAVGISDREEETNYLLHTSAMSSGLNVLRENSPIYGVHGLSHEGKDKNLIGVIFDTFSEDFGSELLRGIERECHRQGLHMLFGCTYGSVQKENELVGEFMDLGAKGIIILCVHGENYSSTLLQLGLTGYPLVLVDRPMKGVPIPCVKTDSYAASHELTEHILKNKYKKICLVTHSSLEVPTIAERYAGFTDAVIESGDVAGVLASMRMPDGDAEITRGGQIDISGALEVLKEHDDCNAFITTEYRVAVLLDKAATELKKKITIATFDELPVFYDGGNKFQHIRQDENRIGTTAVSTLIKIINGEKINEIISIPYELVE